MEIVKVIDDHDHTNLDRTVLIWERASAKEALIQQIGHQAWHQADVAFSELRTMDWRDRAALDLWRNTGWAKSESPHRVA